jgi:hypothetical protein
MPYIITTMRPANEAERREGYALAQTSKYGRAVATLKEARQDARNIIEDHAQQPGWTAEYIEARETARALPESGGTIGPLPDGTVIEVERADVAALKAAALIPAGQNYSTAYIIDAWNARNA